MTLLLWIEGILLYLIGILGAKVFGLSFLKFNVSVLFSLIPLCIGIAAFFHLVFKVARDGIQGTVLLLILIIGMVLCSGTLIPVAYLPDVVKNMGSVMPLTFWNTYCVTMFFEQIGFAQIGVGIGIGCLEFLIGEVVAWKNT